MINLKIQKKDELIYLVGLEEADLKDLSVENAVLTIRVGENKVSLTKVNTSREEFMKMINEMSQVEQPKLIIP